ncbi:MAG: hypothetical protein ACRC4G_02255, partial [Alphaproteobacteria bacterium]
MTLKQNFLLGMVLLSVSSQALTMPNRPNSDREYNAGKTFNKTKYDCIDLKQNARSQILNHWKAGPSETSKISKSCTWNTASAANLLSGQFTQNVPSFSQRDGTDYLFAELANGNQGAGMLNAANANKPGG